MTKYYKAADILPTALVDEIMEHIAGTIPDWGGGTIYLPTLSPEYRGHLSTKERAMDKSLAVVALIDGYTVKEAAAMVDVTEQTIRAWRTKYGDAISTALRSVREGEQDE